MTPREKDLGEDRDRVGILVRIPLELKRDLDRLCAENRTSINSTVEGLIRSKIAGELAVNTVYGKIEGGFMTIASLICMNLQQNIQTQNLLIGLSQGLIYEKYGGKPTSELPKLAREACEMFEKLLKRNEDDYAMLERLEADLHAKREEAKK